MKPKGHSRLFASSTALIVATIATSSAFAASATWNGTTSAIWADATNWAGPPVTAPGAGETATFSNAGNANTTLDLGAGVSIASIAFDTASTAAYTLGSGAAGSQALTLANAGAMSLSATVANNQLVNANVNLSTVANSTATLTNNSASLLTVAGAINAVPPAGNSLLTVTGSGNTTVTGALTETGAGNSALLKTGAGTLTISNSGTYTGTGALGRIPATALGYPLVAREGTLLFNGGTQTVTGELVIGGVVADGGPGQNAKVQIDAGTLAISNWLSLGRGNGIGGVSSDLVANNASIITAADFSAGFNGNSALNLSKGTFTLNGTSSFTVNGNGAFNFGESTGSNMTMTLNNSATVTAAGTGIKRIGNLGTGVLNINNSAAVSFGNQLVYLGYRSGNGTLNMTGGTLTTGGEVRVGGSDTNNGAAENAVGTFTISGGTANLNALTLARGNNNAAVAAGTGIISGGIVNTANDVTLGFAGSNNLGKLTISGGTLNVGTAGTKWLQVGKWDTSKGQLDITSGSVNLYNNTAIKMNADGTVGANVVNQSGGAVTFYSNAGTTVGGTGHLDMQRAGAAASNNTYNLNGGTLTVPQVLSTATTGSRTFNFNGGTLKPAASTAAFFNLGAGTTLANVRDGGAKIDTNGYDVTIAQALVHSNVGGDAATDGGLTKQAAGNLTLTSSNTYTGATSVTGGTLTLGAGGDINTSPSVTVNGSGAKLVQANGSTLSSPVTLTQGAIDGSGAITSLTVANAAGNTLSAGNGAAGQLTVDALTFQGAATVNITATGTNVDRYFQTTTLTTNAAGQVVVNAANTNGFWSPGDYTVINYGSFSGLVSHFAVGSISGLSAQQSATLVDVGGAITLRIVGDSLTWTGLQSSDWTTGAVGGLKNWKYPTSNVTSEFANGNPVLFDDTTSNFSVNLASNVSPTLTVFDNSDPNTYTFSSTGSFGITGGSLIKGNTGTVVVTTNNSTSGAITINGGVLQIGDGTTDGSFAASSLITNNASLVFKTAGTQTLTNPIGGTGVTNMTGTGALTLAGANTFIGGGIVLATGTLNVNHASALGSTIPGTLAISGGILNNTSGAAITTTTAKAQTWSGDFTFTGSNNLNFNGGGVTLANGGSRAVNVAAGILGVGQITSAATGLSLTGTGILAITSGTASNINGPLDVTAGAKLRLNTGADAGTTNDFIATGLTGSGTIENGGGVERWLFANPATDQTFSGTLQNGATGALGFNKGGAGILSLTGSNTHTGRTSITAGTLSVATISNAGFASPIGAAGVDPGSLYIGNNAGTGTLLYTGSDVTLDRGFTAAANGGNSGVIDTNANMTFTGLINAVNAGGFIKRGTGTLTLSNSNTTQKLSNGANGGGGVLGANVALGKLALKNGTFATVGEVVVGGQLQTAGVYNAAFLDITNAGTLTVPSWVSIGRGNGTTGLSSVLTIDGGTLSQTLATAGLAMGFDAAIAGFNAAPTLTAKGASTVNVAGFVNVGESLGSDATVNVQGTSVVNFTNATVANKSIGASGRGTLNLTSGTVNAGTGLTLGKNADGAGTINLDGGVLDTASIIGGLGTSTLHFNGGSLRANATGVTFLQGITTANVDIGGALIDTQAFNITVAQALSAGTGTAGLTKAGTGVLTLGGINTFIGNTTVSAGTVILADNAGLKFVIAANGVANKMTGIGIATLDGDFTFDLTGAAIANGNSWTLVDTTTKSFTTNFTVAGFTEVANVWTKVDGNKTWTFTEADGKLTLGVSAGGYSSWATTHANGETADGDYDKDGVKNGLEYFMGATGSTFTANPALVGGMVSWPKDPAYNGTYTVQTSPDLVNWTNAASTVVGNSVQYTPADNLGKVFVRLVVIPN